MIALIYLILAVGGIGMIFPFLLMLRLSTSDASDDNTLQIAPSFWWDKDSLAKKYLLKRYYGLSQNPFSPRFSPPSAPCLSAEPSGPSPTSPPSPTSGTPTFPNTSRSR